MAATRTRRKGGTAKVDAYKLVTDQIVEALEAGFVPWHKPWRTSGAGDAPMSLSTRKPYRGVNVFILGINSHLRGYSSRWWGTYKQITERGGQVRRGEKATAIVFWRIFESGEKGSDEYRKVPVLRYYSVFNLEQCDGIEDPTPLQIDEEIEPLDECDRIVDGYLSRSAGLVLLNGGDSAFYHPTLDRVQMPKLGQFESADHYYGALFHEMGHSTGHESRLKRFKDMGALASFGSPDYSEEELVAEMTAAFVCGAAGIDVNVPHRAGYIQGWLSVFQGDTKVLVKAAGRAQRAADLILGVEPSKASENTNGEEKS